MYLRIQRAIQERFVEVVRRLYQLDLESPALDSPPNLEMGDISIAACFELARQLRRPPRKIAEELAARLVPLENVEKVSVAGAGYLNFYLDRSRIAAALFDLRRPTTPPPPSGRGKILVEHTSINPNKAAHIGHLRNAVLGDTFVRLLRFRGDTVEIQNYIDNTGVQVADVVVGFIHLESKAVSEVENLVRDPSLRFDYYCWDLYARVFQYYAEHEDSRRWRLEALKAIEEGHGDAAHMADLISTAIVRAHLATMVRLGIRYDLLVQESEILKLDFWKQAFELLQKNGAIHFETSGKNAGCWVMNLGEGGETDEESGAEDVKIIVRSNGTVTYVGKDIAYHLWKFALLGKDFGYVLFERYPDGQPVWRTSTAGQSGAPPLGQASIAYAVIDTRQSYLQNVVKAAFEALGLRDQAANMYHFAYEVVGLTPRCAEEMGVELTEEDRQRPYIEVSGRKGLGVKADDLMDRMVAKALEEVRARQLTPDPAEQETCARQIGLGALRYFLLKYSRRVIIAFDFKDALSFEGETGPYLQYTVVRARNIFRKLRESQPDFQPEQVSDLLPAAATRDLFAGNDALAFWELARISSELELAIEQAISAEEPAVAAKYAFRLAQSFNNFYHRFHILSEEDATRQRFLLYLVFLVERTLTLALELMGIEIPERM